MRILKTFIFSLINRVKKSSRVSAGAYIKGHANIELGCRCKIHDAASVDAARTAKVILGDQVTINRYAYLQGDKGGIRLGARVEVNNFVIINGTGGVDIGDDTLIGPGVRIISYQHQIDADQVIRDQASIASPIRIGKGVWIGANAVILAGVTIEDGAVVGAGAVVTRDIPRHAVVVGVPAKIMKFRT